jgi:hypothetical protein
MSASVEVLMPTACEWERMGRERKDIGRMSTRYFSYAKQIIF